jgi:hypothetical protein
MFTADDPQENALKATSVVNDVYGSGKTITVNLSSNKKDNTKQTNDTNIPIITAQQASDYLQKKLGKTDKVNE